MEDEKKPEVLAPEVLAPKRPRARTSRHKINMRENKFAHGMVQHGDKQRAMLEAGYNPAPHKVGSAADKVYSRPRVQAKIDELLAEKYPDHEADFSRRLQEVLNLPLKVRRDDPGISVPELTEVLRFIASMKGYQAPTKHATLRTNFSAALPKE